MSQKKKETLYELYRNLPGVAPKLTSLFQNLDQNPDDPRSHFELGEAAHRAGVLQLSAECFSKVTELAPHVDAGFFNLGNVFFDLKEFKNAKQAYERALHLSPDGGTLNNLGNSYAAMRDWENAIQTFDRALKLAECVPKDAYVAFSNKGKTLIATEDWGGALENYMQAIQRFPDDIGFLSLKARCHQRQFEFGKAMDCLVQAIVISPEHPELLCQIADLNFCRGHTIESLLCMSHAFTIKPPPPSLHSRRLRMLTYCVSATPERLLNETKSWAASLGVPEWKFKSEPSVSSLVTNKDPPSNRTLRVGILCRDLPSRGLSDWLPAQLAHFDPERVQWFVYCDQSVNKETQNELIRAGCILAETAQLSDKDLVSLIKSDQLHVLIDMIGHDHSTRLQVIARRPAPVQVAWCAFPMTSGLTQMDYIWSDLVSIPVESEEFFTEKVIRFHQSSFCFQPSCLIDLRIENEIRQSPFYCGFLGQPEQISDLLVQIMCSILDSVPDAELVFVGQAYRDSAFQSEIRGKFEKLPVKSSRVQFQSCDSDLEELEAYQQLDVSLDPALVCSPQRAFESLWMGVPVITLVDDRFSGRGTASILHSLNRKAWIAKTQSDYIEVVKQLAENRALVRSQRAALRSELLASPMCNLKLIAANIQSAIDETLRRTYLT